MTNEHSRTRDHDPTLPADLADVSGLLDRAGAAERAGAPRGLEARLFDGTRGALAESTGVVARIGPAGWALSARFRLAAGVAVAAIGVGAAAWLASRGTPTGASKGVSAVSVADITSRLEADLAAWEREREAYAVTGVETQLAALHEALDTLESGGTEDPWIELDAGTEEPSL